MPGHEITRPATLPALLERCGGAEAARGAAGGAGSRPEPWSSSQDCARLPGRRREASAPPARSKSAGRVAERLISCLVEIHRSRGVPLNDYNVDLQKT